METQSHPTLIDWMLARHAAGLPIVSRTPQKPRADAHTAGRDIGDAGPPPQSSTEVLSNGKPRFTLNIRGADDAENGGKPPPGSSTDMLSISSGGALRSGVNVRAGDTAKTREKPPSRSSTDRLSFADGFALVDELREDRLDAWFAALADPTRRARLAMLMRGECSVGTLAAPHAMSLTAAARHVAVLDRAGLVERRRIGRRHLCRLRAAILAEAAGWLDRFARRDACRPAPVR
ncbi:ArsR/SmtB family transcription factor [Sphingomonas sp. RS2018]